MEKFSDFKLCCLKVRSIRLLGLMGLFTFFLLTGCAHSPEQTSVPNPLTNPIKADESIFVGGGQIMGNKQLQVQLSEGQAQQGTSEPVPQVTGEPLMPEEARAIFDRLPGLPLTPSEQKEFQYPVELLPPPRPGTVIPQTFPPEATQTPVVPSTTEPLTVLRYAPEGEIPIAPFISITFNQPMVPLGTLADLATLEVPVKLQPTLPGTWRWLGTKTLTFEYDSEQIDRLPKATEYRVTIPSGVKSLSGAELLQEVSWTFSTPAPKVIEIYPENIPQTTDPLVFLHFDQRIDPQAVLETITMFAGSQPVKLRLATVDEIEENEEVKQGVDKAMEGRWLVFKALEPLLPDTTVSVTVGPGTPSAEGPLITTTAQSFSFYTYAPLRVVEYGCSGYEDDCVPLAPFTIQFNNSLDSEIFSEDWISADPPIPGMVVNAVYSSITIMGETRGQTTYKVTLSSSLRDIFGQTLGKDQILTFKVGKAEPLLMRPNKYFVTLDPQADPPSFSFYARNYQKVRIQIYAVSPADWNDYLTYYQEWVQSDTLLEIPGKQVLDELRELKIPEDTLTEVQIDLAPYLKGGYGQFIIKVEPPPGFFATEDEKWQRFNQTIHAWVQVTDIGLDAYVDHSDMVVWVNQLRDGRPLAGISISSSKGNTGAVTNAEGIARFPIPDGARYLVARQGEDVALLPNSPYPWGDSRWTRNTPSDFLRWYVFDDRGIYRPGEEVHVKGWVRLLGGDQQGDVGLPGVNLGEVNYRVTDSQGNELLNGSTVANTLGGFDFAFSLPEVVNLGEASIDLYVKGGFLTEEGNSYSHSFQIEEFRTPEFEVNARNVTTGPYFAGGEALLAVQAKYYAGGGLQNAPVTWQVQTSPGKYIPPNWSDFVFGDWHPWWMMSYDYIDSWREDESTTETFSGTTDVNGEHFLKLDFIQPDEDGEFPEPKSIVAQATVMDVNRQAWAGSTTLLVHPAEFYIGLRSEKFFVERGTPLKVDFIVTDLDGNAIAGQLVNLTAARLEWKYQQGEWVEVETDPQTCRQTSNFEPGTCRFETPLGGSYRITAEVRDSSGRINKTRIRRWVSGGQQPPARNVEQETVTLIPDRENYQPGETAHILVKSPFSPAEGLLTVGRSGFLYTQRFTIENGTTTLSIPIKEEYIPNISIQVDLSGAAPRVGEDGEVIKNASPRPAYATASMNLSIPPVTRSLTVQVNPEETSLQPGGSTILQLHLTDASGNPVPDAEFAVIVVDEAILALSNYQLANPLDVFYTVRDSGISSTYARSSIILANPLNFPAEENLAAMGGGSGIDFMRATQAEAPLAMDSMKSALTQTSSITIRTNFNPLANFSPSVRTNGKGNARLQVTLPDNLTRYRIMVVATDESGQRFGQGEANLTARLPLMVRPSAPRFLNFGDRFELPVVVQNQTETSMDVEVVARATNLEILQPGMRITVPANDRVEVRFAASTVMTGLARVQIAAVSGTYADAAVVELPVNTPATTEAFATYGVIDEGAISQPILQPHGVFPQFGGLEIETSSTALQALTDAVIYLVDYPFEGSEQIASRILAIASLKDVLSAFQAEELPSPAVLTDQVKSDLDQLQKLQNEDGGFPYWRRGFESIPFNTIHTAHALMRAQQKGYALPAGMGEGTLTYLREIETHYPYWYSEQTRWTLSAYALYVRAQWNDADAAKALRLLNEAGLENLSMEAIGWLWQVIEDESTLQEIRQYVNNHVVETAGAANFTTQYTDQTYLLLSSNRRTDAILLDALIKDNPQSDLIPKLVKGLLAHRTQGRWESTQENVFVLIALDRYFNVYEDAEPDFVARIWLGDNYAGSSEFRGYTTDIYQLKIPMTAVLDETTGQKESSAVILSKEGAGRLYYRLGLKYAPADLDLDPVEMGFVVERRYEALDDPADVSQDADGTWHIRAGARVKVHLTMVADNRRYHVALVDPLPAGLEIINPALSVSQNVPNEDPQTFSYGWWWWRTWYDHQNLREDRAEAFTTLLWDGVYDYTYYARATTPGTFIVPPAKAEEMYSPEVFGRTGSDVVIIK
ncbi:MAG: Ig-like domain-containing protein [Anaerolineaceae bacterium]|nr:Ig-like domain-containing protein [Anaerolineaceae bacterium]